MSTINPTNSNPQINPDALIGQVPTETKVVEELVPILSEESIKLAKDSGTKRVEENEKTPELKDVPEIDDAEYELLMGIAADLEALIALLTAEQDEASIEASKKRIESLQGQLKAQHESTMQKVNESIEEMKKQEKSALANKILGWLGVAVAIVAAVAMCLTVGGSAAALAVVGAVVGLAMQVLNETGAMEKIVKGLSDLLRKAFPNLSKEAADAIAQAIISAIVIAFSLTCMICSGGASGGAHLIDLAAKTAKTLQVVAAVVNSVLGVASTVASGVSTAINYNAQMKQAEVTETQQLLTELQTLLDQESEDLEELLQKLQDCFAAIVQLLENKQETLNKMSKMLADSGIV